MSHPPPPPESAPNEIALLLDLFSALEREGPGSPEATRMALESTGLRGTLQLRVGDFGCGSGASTAVLSDDLEADLVAVDLFPEFLTRVVPRCKSPKVRPVLADMSSLPFADASFDLIWSEGAIYNIGFVEGLRTWRPLLTPSGVIAVSELSWLGEERPAEIESYWSEQYPGIAARDEKCSSAESLGFEVLDAFTLPEDCWAEHYHQPLRDAIDSFVERNGDSEGARSLARATLDEIDLQERYAAHVGYVFYVLRDLS